MGVSGSGKSTVAQALAQTLGWCFVEGDAFHSADNHAKMQAGIPLTDGDRASWLDALGGQLTLHARQGVLLSCSALKLSYRDQLRRRVPGLRFIWLDVGRDLAQARVAGRGAAHFFPATLIDSQFQALEPPLGEPGLLRVAGDAALADILETATRWLHARNHESI
ncbi:gluconokinase [Pollutimonas sp. M17]|uniref:gluconokinase n=1 Tax=Pollutimonas sp. M17 TaxID=2962065 RepID=UPI0021F4348C|nr:gluconokinase [Pollutimonas sp. M17]UYO93805.1 gluconokinase [Pollutimonas sp. M17]